MLWRWPTSEHESKCAQGSRVIGARASNFASMTEDTLHGKRLSKLGFEEETLA